MYGPTEKASVGTTRGDAGKTYSLTGRVCIGSDLISTVTLLRPMNGTLSHSNESGHGARADGNPTSGEPAYSDREENRATLAT